MLFHAWLLTCTICLVNEDLYWKHSSHMYMPWLNNNFRYCWKRNDVNLNFIISILIGTPFIIHGSTFSRSMLYSWPVKDLNVQNLTTLFSFVSSTCKYFIFSNSDPLQYSRKYKFLPTHIKSFDVQPLVSDISLEQQILRLLLICLLLTKTFLPNISLLKFSTYYDI